MNCPTIPQGPALVTSLQNMVGFPYAGQAAERAARFAKPNGAPKVARKPGQP